MMTRLHPPFHRSTFLTCSAAPDISANHVAAASHLQASTSKGEGKDACRVQRSEENASRRLQVGSLVQTPPPHLRSASWPSPDGCFQQDDQPHGRAQIISNWFLGHELAGLRCPPREQISDQLFLLHQRWSGRFPAEAIKTLKRSNSGELLCLFSCF